MASSSSNEDESSSIALHAMQLATSSIVPMVLKATVELGVLEILEREGPDTMLSPSQIASKIPVKNNPDAHDTLDKMLSLLASHAILSSGVNAFSYSGKNARFSEFFKDSMKEYNELFMSTILDAYKGFEGLDSQVDVDMGINFDLASVIEKSPSYPDYDLLLVLRTLQEMFVSIPKRDAIFMEVSLRCYRKFAETRS
ncbi:caffeic acid 3-O-methyltransferase-like [Eucalyptus grandis]|uniref:caffeic acid 3-O-methyltransferase-like n=1 Tax=Eucalyptus grandis TaxID=71139 RepID=UPI00192EA7A5|nr:caffeic acid 3-O-methyltransferase-like [Eucalyptus grandis]